MHSGAGLIKRLEADYPDRARDRASFRKTWIEFSALFQPGLAGYPIDGMPSLLLARDAGDLGLAMLWIVESALIRSVAFAVRDLVPDTSPVRSIIREPSLIGALAHSEDSARPAVIEPRGERIAMRGFKKYITGGTDADFIFITARMAGDEKITKLVGVPVRNLPPEALRTLAMESLRTTGHASLTLDGITLPASYLIPLEPGTLRREIKRWGIIERSLIMQAFIGLLVYLAHALDMNDTVGELDRLLALQNDAAARQIAQALNGETIAEGGAGMREVMALSGRIQGALEGAPSPLAARRDDLSLFNSLKP